MGPLENNQRGLAFSSAACRSTNSLADFIQCPAYTALPDDGVEAVDRRDLFDRRHRHADAVFRQDSADDVGDLPRRAVLRGDGNEYPVFHGRR